MNIAQALLDLIVQGTAFLKEATYSLMSLNKNIKQVEEHNNKLSEQGKRPVDIFPDPPPTQSQRNTW